MSSPSQLIQLFPSWELKRFVEGYDSLLRSRSLGPTRGDGERCVTPARAAAKETRVMNDKENVSIQPVLELLLYV